jgi:hypothetical protein
MCVKAKDKMLLLITSNNKKNTTPSKQLKKELKMVETDATSIALTHIH